MCVLPHSDRDLPEREDRLKRRVTGAAIAAALTVTLLSAPAVQSIHAGTSVWYLSPDVAEPGDLARMYLRQWSSTYAAPHIFVSAPTVDGEQLSVLPEETKEIHDIWAPYSHWEVNLTTSTPTKIHYEWQTEEAATETGSPITPRPPRHLFGALDGSQPEAEGDATWTVEFCTGGRYVVKESVQTTVAGVPISTETDVDVEAFLCIDGHSDEATHTFDNQAPTVDVTLTDPQGHTSPPFHENVTVQATAIDDGIGVEAVTLGNETESGSTVAKTYNVSGRHNRSYEARDRFENVRHGEVNWTVVGGVSALTGQPGPITAGDNISILAGYSATPGSDDPTWITSATGDIDLTTVAGPASGNVTAVGPLSDGVRPFNFTATQAGSYTLNATASHVPDPASVDVDVEPASLDTIDVSPGSTIVETGGVLQFDASGEDVYGNDVDFTPSWTASCGSITPSGQYIAPDAPRTCTVRAEHGDGPDAPADEASVTIQALDTPDEDDGSSPTTLSVANLTSPSHDLDDWSSDDEVEMTWDAPDGEVAGYAVALTAEDGAVGTEPDTDRTSIVVDATQDGTYTFEVRPIPDGDASSEVSTFGPIRIDTEAPLPPDDADPGIGDGGLELSWSAVTADEGSPVAAYAVERTAEDGSWDRLAEVTDGTAFVDDRIPAPGTYRYRLRSIDAAGNEGPPTSPIPVLLGEIPGAATAGGMASTSQLYETLSLEPGDASFEDRDGDGAADAIVGDDRLSLWRVTEAGGETAYLVSVEGRDQGALVTEDGDAHPVEKHPAEIRSRDESPDALHVTADAGPLPGWSLVSVPDTHPDREILGVLDERDRIAGDRYWRLDGSVAILDEDGGSYTLMYETVEDPSRRARGQPAVPGPSALLAVAGLLGAATWVARRRDR